jgi:hypothetical protein
LLGSVRRRRMATLTARMEKTHMRVDPRRSAIHMGSSGKVMEKHPGEKLVSPVRRNF